MHVHVLRVTYNIYYTDTDNRVLEMKRLFQNIVLGKMKCHILNSNALSRTCNYLSPFGNCL